MEKLKHSQKLMGLRKPMLMRWAIMRQRDSKKPTLRPKD